MGRHLARQIVVLRVGAPIVERVLSVAVAVVPFIGGPAAVLRDAQEGRSIQKDVHDVGLTNCSRSTRDATVRASVASQVANGHHRFDHEVRTLGRTCNPARQGHKPRVRKRTKPQDTVNLRDELLLYSATSFDFGGSLLVASRSSAERRLPRRATFEFVLEIRNPRYDT